MTERGRGGEREDKKVNGGEGGYFIISEDAMRRISRLCGCAAPPQKQPPHTPTPPFSTPPPSSTASRLAPSRFGQCTTIAVSTIVS